MAVRKAASGTGRGFSQWPPTSAHKSTGPDAGTPIVIAMSSNSPTQSVKVTLGSGPR